MQNEFKSFKELKSTIENNQDFIEKIKEDPVKAIKPIKLREPWFNDRIIYRLVVLFLGVIVLTICIGLLIIFSRSKPQAGFEVPDIFIATASSAIGAIAGLLTPNSNSQESS